jgi:hypothetical protein
MKRVLPEFNDRAASLFRALAGWFGYRGFGCEGHGSAMRFEIKAPWAVPAMLGQRGRASRIARLSFICRGHQSCNVLVLPQGPFNEIMLVPLNLAPRN